MAQAARHATDEPMPPAVAGSTRSGPSPPTATATGWTGAALSASPETEAQKLDAARAAAGDPPRTGICEEAAAAEEGRSRTVEQGGRTIG